MCFPFPVCLPAGETIFFQQDFKPHPFPVPLPPPRITVVVERHDACGELFPAIEQLSDRMVFDLWSVAELALSGLADSATGPAA